jgi:hypothetical protein
MTLYGQAALEDLLDRADREQDQAATDAIVSAFEDGPLTTHFGFDDNACDLGHWHSGECPPYTCKPTIEATQGA